MERPYYIRCYQPGDENQIIRLFTAVFGHEITLSQWRWKYHPPGNNTPYAYVALDSSGKLLAHIGAVPLRGQSPRGEILFFQICDIMVTQEARGHNDQRRVYVDLARSFFEHLTAHHPDSICYGFPGTRPFKAGHFFKLYESIEDTPTFELAAAKNKPLFTLLKMRTLSWEDESLDSFWNHYPKHTSLLLCRDRSYLSWRYRDNPYRKYNIVGLYRSAQLQGWAVYTVRDDKCLVTDMLVRPKHVKKMLHLLGPRARSEGMHKITFWAPEPLRNSLEQVASTLSGVVTTNVVWKTSVATSTMRDHLYYTMGDNDVY